MPDWDEDRPQLRKNLTGVLKEIIQAAEQRETPTLEMARRWHTLEKVRVRVAGNYGVEPADVAEELRRFETTVLTLVAQLDESLPIDREPNADQLAAIIDLCAWAHAEWIRIQPFANGNGRTARLWQIVSPCAMACPLLCGCARDPTQVTALPA